MAEFPSTNQESTTYVTSQFEAEANSSFGSNGIENSSFQLTVEKLNGRNFWKWPQSIKVVIDGKGKLGYLNNDTKRPNNAKLLTTWNSENSMITAWLVNSIKPSTGKTYLFLHTAKDVWEAIKETYADWRFFAHLWKKTQLWQTKQGTRDITDYYMEMVSLWQESDLSSYEEWKCPKDIVLYKKKQENKRVYEFLAGLNWELDDIRGQILGRWPLPPTHVL